MIDEYYVGSYIVNAWVFLIIQNIVRSYIQFTLLLNTSMLT